MINNIQYAQTLSQDDKVEYICFFYSEVFNLCLTNNRTKNQYNQYILSAINSNIEKYQTPLLEKFPKTTKLSDSAISDFSNFLNIEHSNGHINLNELAEIFIARSYFDIQESSASENIIKNILMLHLQHECFQLFFGKTGTVSNQFLLKISNYLEQLKNDENSLKLLNDNHVFFSFLFEKIESTFVNPLLKNNTVDTYLDFLGYISTHDLTTNYRNIKIYSSLMAIYLNLSSNFVDNNNFRKFSLKIREYCPYIFHPHVKNYVTLKNETDSEFELTLNLATLFSDVNNNIVSLNKNLNSSINNVVSSDIIEIDTFMFDLIKILNFLKNDLDIKSSYRDINTANIQKNIDNMESLKFNKSDLPPYIILEIFEASFNYLKDVLHPYTTLKDSKNKEFAENYLEPILERYKMEKELKNLPLLAKKTIKKF